MTKNSSPGWLWRMMLVAAASIRLNFPAILALVSISSPMLIGVLSRMKELISCFTPSSCTTKSVRSKFAIGLLFWSTTFTSSVTGEALATIFFAIGFGCGGGWTTAATGAVLTGETGTAGGGTILVVASAATGRGAGAGATGASA